MKLLRMLPNLLTLANLFCGMIGIWIVFRGEWRFLLLVGSLSLIFDFFDGFLAKRLDAASDIGKELDSLSDVVSFGVLPAIILKEMYIDQGGQFYVSFLFYLMALFASWRLASFNIDTRQTKNFIGIPTPAVFVFVLGLVNSFISQDSLFTYMTPATLLFFGLFFSIMMVAPVKMMAFKNITQNYLDIFYIIFFVVVIICLSVWGVSGFVPIIFAYIIISLIKFYVYKNDYEEVQS